MRRILALSVLAIMAIGLFIIIIMSLANQEIYGRFGTVVRLADFPVKYIAGILLLIVIFGMVIFGIKKVWQDH